MKPERIGLGVAEMYELPEYPYDTIATDVTHPLYDQWRWDQEFMEAARIDWCAFYGALVELRIGANPCVMEAEARRLAPDLTGAMRRTRRGHI